MLNLFEENSSKTHEISHHDTLSKKCANLEKRNHALLMQNNKLQKQNEEIGQLNLAYEKRHLLCTCKRFVPNQAVGPKSDQHVEESLQPSSPAQESNSINTFSLNVKQMALLEHHLTPELKTAIWR